MGEVNKAFLEKAKENIENIVEAETPAKHLGVFDKKGKDADFVITDVELNVKQVLSGGKLVCA